MTVLNQCNRWARLAGARIHVLAFTGCHLFETEYVWKRTPNESFAVHLRLEANKKLVMLEQYWDGTSKTYPPNIREYFEDCKYFDKDNL